MSRGVLVLLRHGESVANAAQEFTGLLDVGLTERGVEQARAAARLLVGHGVLPDLVVTSPMLRSVATTEVVVDEAGLGTVPVRRSWRLAERDYGHLTGVAKSRARELYGAHEYVTVRRTLDGRPPAATAEQSAAWAHAFTDPSSGLPTPGAGESLRDVIARVDPQWVELRAAAAAGSTVLVVAHGNSLRALCTLVDRLSPDEVMALNLPPAQPLVYEVTSDGSTRPRGGRYLDPTTALAAATVIAHEGGT